MALGMAFTRQRSTTLNAVKSHLEIIILVLINLLQIWNNRIFQVLKEMSYDHQSYIYLIKNKVKNNSAVYITHQHIRMSSEGSCDTEDWSNDAENSTLHHRNKLHFKIYSIEMK